MQVAGLVPSSGGFIRSHMAIDRQAWSGNMALRRRRGRNWPETGRWVWGRQHGRNPWFFAPHPHVLEATFGFLAFAISPLLQCCSLLAGVCLSPESARDAMAAPFGLYCLCIRASTFRCVLTPDEAELTEQEKVLGDLLHMMAPFFGGKKSLEFYCKSTVFIISYSF
jgi:hypothetical protein